MQIIQKKADPERKYGNLVCNKCLKKLQSIFLFFIKLSSKAKNSPFLSNHLLSFNPSLLKKKYFAPTLIAKLKEVLTVKDTAFNKSTHFPSVSTKPAHIHFKVGDVPIPIPLHWIEKLKHSLNK